MPQYYIAFPSIWLNNLKFVEQRNQIPVFNILILPPILLLLELCCPGCLQYSPTPTPLYLVRLVYSLLVHRYIFHCYDIETIHVHQSVGHGALLCFTGTVFVRHLVCCGPLLGLSILCAVMDCTLVITYSAVSFCCK